MFDQLLDLLMGAGTGNIISPIGILAGLLLQWRIMEDTLFGL